MMEAAYEVCSPCSAQDKPSAQAGYEKINAGSRENATETGIKPSPERDQNKASCTWGLFLACRSSIAWSQDNKMTKQVFIETIVH
jgi:hypothetical protein